jgi:Protein of unknown function (DUF3015)
LLISLANMCCACDNPPRVGTPQISMRADGVIQESQTARLFTAVAFENLEQDIARGNGEYLTSLAVLLKIPSVKQDEFMTRSQSNYSLLIAPDIRTAEKSR